MLRHIKHCVWLGLLAASMPGAWAFSLSGPFNEAYQVRDLGYHIDERGDIDGPKNWGEEYRRNVPTVYYSFDQSFLDFFGARGAAEIDKAFYILNCLDKVSNYSADLSEWPLESRRDNYRAGVLGLYDLKSYTLGLLLEQLGLTDPVRYVWCLHDREAGADCPNGNMYSTEMRNFGYDSSDLNSLVYSPYVNGVLYTYVIREYCQNPPFGYGLSESWNMPVDYNLYLQNPYLPVTASSGAKLYQGGLGPGAFFTGLTRDDVAGLRYLLRAGNVNWESNPNGAIALATNSTPGALSLLVTSNLTDFATASVYTNDAGLQALYPGVVIASSIPSFTNIITSNTVYYYTNYPWSPAGMATLVSTNSFDTNVVLIYNRTFANVVTNYLAFGNGYKFTNNNVFAKGTPWNMGWVTVVETNIGPVASTDPYGQPVVTAIQTNITTTRMLTNMVMGDFFIIPTNACGYQLLSNVLSKVYSLTNTFVATNAPINPQTNAFSSNYFSFYSRTTISYWTNHNFAYFPVLCQTNLPGLRRGIEKINFVRRDYDSLLGQYWYPQTNNFTLITVTNYKDTPVVFQRVATQPDFLFTARDLTPGPAGDPRNYFDWYRTMQFNTNNSLTGLAGPGVIDSPTTIGFNKSGPVFFNEWTNQIVYLDEATQVAMHTWGSYDDTTNAPVVYPNTTSLQQLESMMLLKVVPTTQPDGQVGVPYYTQIYGAGGQGPYSLSLSPDSPSMPPGMALSQDGQGIIYGTPTAAGTYDFIVRLTDSLGHFADWDLAVTIYP